MKKLIFGLLAIVLLSTFSCDMQEFYEILDRTPSDTPGNAIEAPISPIDSMLIQWQNREPVLVGNMNLMSIVDDINELGVALIDGPHINIPGVPHYRFQIVHENRDTAYYYDYTVIVEYMLGSERMFLEKPVTGHGSFSLYANTLSNSRIHFAANALRKGTYMPSLAASRRSKMFYFTDINGSLVPYSYN